MKKIIIPCLFIATIFMSGCAEMQQIATQLPGNQPTQQGVGGVSNATIGQGLKEALNLGLKDGIATLGKSNGFYQNPVAKILLPTELQNVEKTLRSLGLGSMADEGLKLLNRAAEDAVSEAAPIFSNAITSMSFNDAKGILLGNQNAATAYLQNKTTTELTTAFQPKIEQSLGKVGANQVWTKLISQYNTVSAKKVNPDLNAYVTEQAIQSVFRMVAQKEEGIRSNIGLRTTPLLQQVFGLQDKK